jgi:hypothetical protein
MKPVVDFIVANHAIVVESVQRYSVAKQAADAAPTEQQKNNYEAQAEQASRKYFAAIQRLADHMTQPVTPGPQLICPESMRGLIEAYRKFRRLGAQVDPNNLTDQDRDLIVIGARDVVEADQALAVTWNSRPPDYSSQNYSTNLSVEFGGIPFKFDMLNGEIKVSYSHQIGPIKLSGAAGPTSRGGIKTLILQNDQYRRYFAVGGKPIRLEVPESVLTTDGDIMTITAVSR